MSRTIRFFAVVLVVLASAVSPFASADLCTYYQYPEPHVVCEPEYYVWQYSEPSWCLYGQYDEVVIEYSPTPTWHAVRWYVTPASDPGRDGDYYVIHDINGSCYAWPYPF